MNNNLIIGLTGGIASGKSTVCKFFSDLSIPIIDADKISHNLTKKNGLAYPEIIEHFGKEIDDFMLTRYACYLGIVNKVYLIDYSIST